MADNLKKERETIIKLLSEKSVMKQNVYANTLKVFEQLGNASKDITEELAKDIKRVDSRVTLDYKDFNQQSFQLKVAGDVLQFDMHTNVFEFEKSNPLFKSGYIKQNEMNSFCGVISVYNFLADSFKFNRVNDVGFLIARIFINREMRFLIETKTGLNYKFGNYSEAPITEENINDIINELIIFAVSFDLFIPPYESVKQVSVLEIQEKASSTVLKTGKRLGYLGHGSDDISFGGDVNL